MAVAGCGGGQRPLPHDHAGNGYLLGTVTRGPTTPVCREGTPCSAPASGVRLGFARDNGGTVTVVTAKDGSYSVSLTPGHYTVTVLSNPMIGPGIQPQRVSVTPALTRTVNFQIDTGIR